MDPAMKRVFALATLLLAASCASTPKPCTAEWFDWKTDRYLDEFAHENRQDIADLLSASRSLNDEGGSAAVKLPAKILAGAKAVALASKFLSGTVPEIKSAVSECGTTPRAAQLFASLLRREGFDDKTVKAVEDLGVLLDRDGQ